jgi:hypothetical protein
MRFTPQKTAGISLVEAILVSALILLVFGGLFTGIQYSLELVAQSRAKLSALSLANDRMELFRSLPYDDVGTIAGIPPGTIPQNSTSTLNGIEFGERVLVEYVDDPADGQLTATSTDNNGIPSDYKRIKIELTWNVYDTLGEIALVSNIVPRSIETTVGGGTVRANVIDQDSLPLENVSVQLRNDTTTSTIDITRFTDASGSALFSGAPAASSYELLVTAPGYSTDQTYVATTSNPNPVTSPFTVLESDISTLTFQIDELSDINTTVLSNVTFLSEDQVFTSSSSVATSSNTEIVSDEVVLARSGSTYVSSGEVYLTAIAPSPIVAWEAATIGVATPGSTDFRVQFYTASGTSYTVIPDGSLPGNGTGFTDTIIDISELNPFTYPSIVARITLATSDTSLTPAVSEFRTFYRSAQAPASGVPIGWQGSKTIGTDAGTPIYKYAETFSTDSNGEIEMLDIEFDTYQVTVPASFDVAYACPDLPLQHRGGEDSDLEIALVSNTTNSLQVRVRDDTGNQVPGATVLLEQTSPSFSETQDSNPCGAAFFSGLAASTDYILTVSKPGYLDATIDPLEINGDAKSVIILNAI